MDELKSRDCFFPGPISIAEIDFNESGGAVFFRRRFLSNISREVVQCRFPERPFPESAFPERPFSEMSETTFPRTTLGPLG
jgi:hypothetical protein